MNFTCPRCANPFLQRVPQDGRLERLLGRCFIYHFLCQICRHCFHAMRWGIRYDREPGDRRQYARRPVRFPATLASRFGEHEGRATELSLSGCSIAVFAPYGAGDELSIRLNVLDDKPPIEVDKAVVRTVSEGQLGMEFLALRDPEEARLRELMLALWVEGTKTGRGKG